MPLFTFSMACLQIFTHQSQFFHASLICPIEGASSELETQLVKKRISVFCKSTDGQKLNFGDCRKAFFGGFPLNRHTINFFHTYISSNQKNRRKASISFYYQHHDENQLNYSGGCQNLRRKQAEKSWNVLGTVAGSGNHFLALL